MPVLPLVGSTMMVSGPILPARFGRLDHGQADPVLDAVGRIVELELGQDVGAAPLGQARMRTSGVLPISSVTSFAIRICPSAVELI
jgi:hypothetical protein